jgi:hypothetical protein
MSTTATQTSSAAATSGGRAVGAATVYAALKSRRSWSLKPENETNILAPVGPMRLALGPANTTGSLLVPPPILRPLVRACASQGAGFCYATLTSKTDFIHWQNGPLRLVGDRPYWYQPVATGCSSPIPISIYQFGPDAPRAQALRTLSLLRVVLSARVSARINLSATRLADRKHPATRIFLRGLYT